RPRPFCRNAIFTRPRFNSQPQDTRPHRAERTHPPLSSPPAQTNFPPSPPGRGAGGEADFSPPPRSNLSPLLLGERSALRSPPPHIFQFSRKTTPIKKWSRGESNP